MSIELSKERMVDGNEIGSRLTNSVRRLSARNILRRLWNERGPVADTSEQYPPSCI